jgi:hypothetical protein
MLKATEEEIEEVREYFEWQAPDLEVTFMQKVYSEAVVNTRHDVWDIHTNKNRWWVITGGTKGQTRRIADCYPQEKLVMRVTQVDPATGAFTLEQTVL